jgi:hypothetical protein
MVGGGMTGGRTVWWPKDSAWWRREHIVELGEEFGADGPAVLDWLSCEAKAQNDGGRVKTGYKSIARGCFVDLVTVRHAVSRAVQLGALDDFEEQKTRFEARISGWSKDNERGRASLRQQDARTRVGGAVEPNGEDGQGVTQRDVSRVVTVRHAESPTGQDSSKEPPISPEADSEWLEWISDHQQVTGHQPPGEKTKGYRALYESFHARRREGIGLAELKLATRGAHAEDFRREHGYDVAESVLRPKKVGSLIARGRMREKADGPAAGKTLAQLRTEAAERARKLEEPA